jgi:2-methylisocitrate lyase-like PEP mutase family enzyme
MTKHRVAKSAEYRRLIQSQQPHTTVFGATAHHAQLAQATGFKVFGVSGSNLSTHILGMPDAGLTTMTELAECVRNICRAVSIPVLVDVDTGFGNALNVRRTVEEIIRAGAAGIFLEDQLSPKRCGWVKGKELVDIEEAVGKYRAACDIRDELDPDFIIMARTDARGAIGGGFDEVVRRGQAYLRTGVDVLYVEALQDREEVRRIREIFPSCPLTISIRPILSDAEMVEFRICTAWLHVAKVGAVAMYDFLQKYAREGRRVWEDYQVATQKHPLGGFGLFELTGFPELTELERKYLPAHRLEKYDQSLGAYDPRSTAESARATGSTSPKK